MRKLCCKKNRVEVHLLTWKYVHKLSLKYHIKDISLMIIQSVVIGEKVDPFLFLNLHFYTILNMETLIKC